MKQHAPATMRNREPILAVLDRILPEIGTVLEIASGSGEHAVYMAAQLPGITWQPTDQDSTALASIEAWRAEAGLPNLLPPLVLDVTRPWPVESTDAIVCCNMIHISPWEATLALFAGAGRVLAPGGLLYLYGPYRFDGVTEPSNEAFDRSLKSRDPSWGVRDVRELEKVAATHQLGLDETVPMPANNHSLVFRKQT